MRLPAVEKSFLDNEMMFLVTKTERTDCETKYTIKTQPQIVETLTLANKKHVLPLLPFFPSSTSQDMNDIVVIADRLWVIRFRYERAVNVVRDWRWRFGRPGALVGRTRFDQFDTVQKYENKNSGPAYQLPGLTAYQLFSDKFWLWKTRRT